ncbi:MAG: SDR family oxidoreductase, partial [Dehalococcoidales bacterium]
MKDFTGKVAFITGGASGAGLGQAKVFSEAGCKVVIADIRQDHLDEAKAYFKDKKVQIHTIKLDITDRKAYAAAADEVEKVFGSPPQLLFNTAGVNAFGPAEASTFEDYDWVMGVDLGGVVNGMVTFVPRMIKAGKGGHIATVASMGGLMGTAGCAPYSAAKAAVINLMESYYIALKPYGIGVTCLCPGGIKSNIGESSYTRPKSLANTGYNTNETTIAFMHKHYSYGIDPVELAHIFKKGIE